MFYSSQQQPNRYSRLTEGAFYAVVKPTAIESPQLVHFNAALATEFGLDEHHFDQSNFLDVLAGKKYPDNGPPLAMAYSGHQFGNFNPTLGDGRAILLNEFRDQHGQSWEFQLKGSGPTPYSRGFDGRAVLRSVIREYLGSEAMWALGVPTTRALCIVASETPVRRERVEHAAMMVRVAPSHVRFGSFERFHYHREPDFIQQLMDYCIAEDHPELVDTEDAYGRWFDDIVVRTAEMVAHWQAVGFCHGVMNTDNFSILGLTFDYGPFGFMETYDPKHICNHSDHEGRYAYDQQPRMAFWNCLCLARALSAVAEQPRLEKSLELFEAALQGKYISLLRTKLGLRTENVTDSTLVVKLLALLQEQQLDYTRFFRGLCDYTPGQAANVWLLQGRDENAINEWLQLYSERLAEEASDNDSRQTQMRAANPKYILRNYLAQQAIEKAEQGDYSELDTLLKLMHTPFAEHPELESYAAPAPEWAQELEVSCSS